MNCFIFSGKSTFSFHTIKCSVSSLFTSKKSFYSNMCYKILFGVLQKVTKKLEQPKEEVKAPETKPVRTYEEIENCLKRSSITPIALRDHFVGCKLNQRQLQKVGFVCIGKSDKYTRWERYWNHKKDKVCIVVASNGTLCQIAGSEQHRIHAGTGAMDISG